MASSGRTSHEDVAEPNGDSMSASAGDASGVPQGPQSYSQSISSGITATAQQVMSPSLAQPEKTPGGAVQGSKKRLVGKQPVKKSLEERLRQLELE